MNGIDDQDTAAIEQDEMIGSSENEQYDAADLMGDEG